MYIENINAPPQAIKKWKKLFLQNIPTIPAPTKRTINTHMKPPHLKLKRFYYKSNHSKENKHYLHCEIK